MCVQPVDAVCSRDRHGKLFFRGRAVPTLELVSLLRAGSRSTPILVFLATPVPVYTSHLLTYTRFSPPHPPPLPPRNARHPAKRWVGSVDGGGSRLGPSRWHFRPFPVPRGYGGCCVPAYPEGGRCFICRCSLFRSGAGAPSWLLVSDIYASTDYLCTSRLIGSGSTAFLQVAPHSLCILAAQKHRVAVIG